MNDLLLKPDSKGKTPLVDFRATGELAIEGRSIIENAIEFYKPVLEWIRCLSEDCPRTIEFTIRLEYFNTSSSKIILNILRSLENLYSSGRARVLVKWQYGEDDVDMHEAGYDYQTLIRLPFKITALVEN
jgi:hypothetical protein